MKPFPRASDTPQQEESSLVASLRVEELFRIFHGRLLRFCLRYVDYHTAEDIVQVTFLKAYAHRMNINEKQNVAPWLHSIALNSIRDLLRAGRGRGRWSHETLADFEDSRAETPLEFLIKQEEQQRLVAARNGLSPGEQEILLSRTNGMSYRAIGKKMLQSPSTIRQNYLKGLEKLRKAM